jgi:hypothetical protein
MKVRRTREQLRDALGPAITTRWQTTFQVSKKAKMDTRTIHRIIQEYLKKYVDDWSELRVMFKSFVTVDPNEVYAVEVARRNGKIIALRRVLINQQGWVSLSELNKG